MHQIEDPVALDDLLAFGPQGPAEGGQLTESLELLFECAGHA
jgi:hypothetical protein